MIPYDGSTERWWYRTVCALTFVRSRSACFSRFPLVFLLLYTWLKHGPTMLDQMT
jgi:hypothetical protein